MPPRRTRRIDFRSAVRDNLLTILIISGVVLGIVAGIVLRSSGVVVSDKTAEYMGFPGSVLIRMLKFIATPLIVTCIICALGGMNLMVSKTLTWQIVVVMIVTKLLVVIIGVVTCIIIEPGSRGTTEEAESSDTAIVPTTIPDIFLDMLRNIFPNNMVSVYVLQYKTFILEPETYDDNLLRWEMKRSTQDSINLLGAIALAFVFGVCLAMMRNKSESLLSLARCVYEISMLVTTGILWSASPFLFFLIMTEIMHIKDITMYLSIWGLFVVTMIVAALVIMLILDPLLLFLLTRTNPFVFYGHMIRAYVTAFATASSLGTMPVLIECLLKHGVDERLVRFVIPIIVTINKDGAAVYLALGSVFVAQLTGVSLDVPSYIGIMVLAAMGSVAAAGVPFSGPVVLLMILQGLGIDQRHIGTILALDWINDRFSTVTSIISNSVVTKFLEHWNQNLLDKLP